MSASAQPQAHLDDQDEAWGLHVDEGVAAAPLAAPSQPPPAAAAADDDDDAWGLDVGDEQPAPSAAVDDVAAQPTTSDSSAHLIPDLAASSQPAAAAPPRARSHIAVMEKVDDELPTESESAASAADATPEPAAAPPASQEAAPSMPGAAPPAAEAEPAIPQSTIPLPPAGPLLRSHIAKIELVEPAAAPETALDGESARDGESVQGAAAQEPAKEQAQEAVATQEPAPEAAHQSAAQEPVAPTSQPADAEPAPIPSPPATQAEPETVQATEAHPAATLEAAIDSSQHGSESVVAAADGQAAETAPAEPDLFASSDGPDLFGASGGDDSWLKPASEDSAQAAVEAPGEAPVAPPVEAPIQASAQLEASQPATISAAPSASLAPPAARPGRHAVKLSVAEAASLFGSSADDPFAAIAEEQEPEPEPEQPAPPQQLSIPQDVTRGASSPLASPSNLFGSGQSGEGDDDWLGGGVAAEAGGEAAYSWPNDDPSQQQHQQPYPQESQAYDYGTTSYDPNAPQQQQYEYASQETGQYANSYAPQQQQYDPNEAYGAQPSYDPQQQQAYGGYDAQINGYSAAPPANPYDPNAYQPSQYGYDATTSAQPQQNAATMSYDPAGYDAATTETTYDQSQTHTQGDWQWDDATQQWVPSAAAQQAYGAYDSGASQPQQAAYDPYAPDAAGQYAAQGYYDENGQWISAGYEAYQAQGYDATQAYGGEYEGAPAASYEQQQQPHDWQQPQAAPQQLQPGEPMQQPPDFARTASPYEPSPAPSHAVPSAAPSYDSPATAAPSYGPPRSSSLAAATLPPPPQSTSASSLPPPPKGPPRRSTSALSLAQEIAEEKEGDVVSYGQAEQPSWSAEAASSSSLAVPELTVTGAESQAAEEASTEPEAIDVTANGNAGVEEALAELSLEGGVGAEAEEVARVPPVEAEQGYDPEGGYGGYGGYYGEDGAVPAEQQQHEGYAFDPEGGYEGETWQEQPPPPQQSAYDPYAPQPSSYEPAGPASYEPAGAASSDPYAPSSNAYGPPHSADPYTPSSGASQSALYAEQAPSSAPADSSPYGYGGVPPPASLERSGTVTQRSYREGAQSPKPGDGAEGGDMYGGGYAAVTTPGYTPSDRRGSTTSNGGYFAGAGAAAAAAAVARAGSSASNSAYGLPASPYEPGYAASVGGYDSRGAPDAAEERKRARIPIACFSIDGKLATFFPDSASSAPTSFDAGASYRVTLRPLHSVVTPTSYSTSGDARRFPGPALETAVLAPTSALSRATSGGGLTSSAKAKKAALLAWLNETATEMARGIGYLRRGADDGKAAAQETEDRITLLRVLALMLEHDGNVTTNPAFDAAVRDLLIGSDSTPSGLPPSSSASSAFPSSTPDVVRTYEVRGSFLDRIEALLLEGKRKEAVDEAVGANMWAHAMAIASGLDKAAWRDVVERFVEHELQGGGDDGRSPGLGPDGLPHRPSNANQRQSLRVAYSLFSGGANTTAIYDVFREKVALSAPASPSADSSPPWRKSAAVVLANRTSGDSLALTAIGDGLLSRGWTAAAHVCYLVSLSTSTIDGADSPGARFTLLAAPSPLASSAGLRDLDHILMTETLEFALSLRPVAKGQEPYGGLPHLQSFRLYHALVLASELGDVRAAQRYCDAIAGVLKSGKMTRHYHRTLLAQLQEFSQRLAGPPSDGSAASGGWMRKMQKPTMDGVWTALEGRFTKFIAGEEDGVPSASGPSTAPSSAPSSTIGPFSHYSAITPDATSGGVSRVQSFADVNRAVPDFAMTRGYAPPSQPISRASSSTGDSGGQRGPAMSSEAGYGAYEPSYGAYEPSSDVYGAATSRGVTENAPWPGASGPDVDGGEGASRSSPPALEERDVPANEPYYGYEAHGAQRPQFFSNVDPDAAAALASDEGGFISTMDALTPRPSYSGVSPEAPPPASRVEDDFVDEEDDLGLGNSSSRKPREAGESETSAPGTGRSTPSRGADAAALAFKKAQEEEERRLKEEQEKKAAAASGSWLGRLLGRRESSETPKAVKAHMGEESAFYYDKDLKRWINKKTGDSGSPSTPPPPPPRAQTASPSMAGGRPPASGPPRGSTEMGRRGSSMAGTPPPIPEHGVAPSPPPGGPPTSPPSSLGVGQPPRRQRSNLGDPNQPAAAQPPMRAASSSGALGGAGSPPPPPGPPPGGSGSRVKKKPISSRYVRID